MKMPIAISPLIRKNGQFFQDYHARSRSKRSQQKMLQNASNEQLLCFVEICLNVLKGRVPLGKRHLRKLGLLKHSLRCLARSRCPRSARQTLLQQGAGIPAMAGVLASILVPLLVDRVAKIDKYPQN